MNNQKKTGRPIKNIDKSIGLRIKNLRNDRSIGQEDIAKIIGISVQGYRNYENGLREIPFDTISTICNILNGDIAVILGLKEEIKLKDNEQIMILYLESLGFEVNVYPTSETDTNIAYRYELHKSGKPFRAFDQEQWNDLIDSLKLATELCIKLTK